MAALSFCRAPKWFKSVKTFLGKYMKEIVKILPCVELCLYWAEVQVQEGQKSLQGSK